MSGTPDPEEASPMDPISTQQPIPVRDLLPALLLMTFLLLAVYLVQFDNGAISQSGSFLHELMHDGRHLLGVPCH
ncbi:MAG: CbtB-domain containing protein [Solirubrobacteraceae bacterium]|nr:CbtB-domain containing protein [Solirubrobacteraceae bacterium]